jgi:hypothetical protein
MTRGKEHLVHGMAVAGEGFDGGDKDRMTFTRSDPACVVQYWIQVASPIAYTMAWVDYEQGIYLVMFAGRTSKEVDQVMRMLEPSQLMYWRVEGSDGSYYIGPTWAKEK